MKIYVYTYSCQIKKAYRKTALKNHPDKGGDVEKFKEISTAYECLRFKLIQKCVVLCSYNLANTGTQNTQAHKICIHACRNTFDRAALF